MNICKNCILNDNISSVTINEDGLCNYCKNENDKNDKNNKNEKNDKNHKNHSCSSISSDEFEKKEKQFIEALAKHIDLPYQVLLAYSGGKDSSYTLYLLRKKYNASVLAVTFDNGFLTEQCRQNIHEVTANLGVDNITIKPAFSNLAKAFSFAGSYEIFPRKSLERASSICTACIGLVKSSVYKEAIMRRIPFVSFGWTPGQVNLKASIVKLDHRMIIANQKQIKDPIVTKFGSEFKKYFMDEEWLEVNKEYIPSLAYPLVFSNYDEDGILETISSIGWKKPADTDLNSTNCLLNSYANSLHISAYGYNPYTLEIATLVREGYMSREEGLRKIADSGADPVIDYVKKQLGKYLV